MHSTTRLNLFSHSYQVDRIEHVVPKNVVVMRKKGKERKKEKRTHTRQPLAGAVEPSTTTTLVTEERGSCGDVAVMG